MPQTQQVAPTGEHDRNRPRRWPTALRLDECGPQSSGDTVPVSLDAEDCLAVINGPAWCSRQFGSIRKWNALGLIRPTEPKYPLLVMRTLCHSLTPLPVWPCRKRAQGKCLHLFFLLLASRNCFFWWGGENERAVDCQLRMVIVQNNERMKKRNSGTSDWNMLKAECGLFFNVRT